MTIMPEPVNSEAIRARIAAATPGPWSSARSRIWGTAVMSDGIKSCVQVADSVSDDDADLIAHTTADLAALCDEVESLRGKLEDSSGQWMHALDRAVGCGCRLGRAEMEDYGRQLGHALVKEIQDHFAAKRKLWEAEARVTWVEEVSGDRMSDLRDAEDREAELTAAFDYIRKLYADMEKSESSREREEKVAARKEHEAYVKTIVPGVRTWLHKMDAINNVAIRAVLDLHRRYGEYCTECDHQESSEYWPCSTVLAISDSYGLTPEGISDWDLVDALMEIDRKDGR